MDKLNDFKTDLKYSLDTGEDILFDNFYRRIFPHLLSIEPVTDIAIQKQGIDKVLVFKNDKRIMVDEKKRRKDWGDIALEEYSNYEYKIPGWLSSSKKTDYIVYAFMKSRVVYLFPFLLLQKVWLKHYPDLLKEYGRLFAQNYGYVTSFIPVDTKTLLNLIKAEMSDAFD